MVENVYHREREILTNGLTRNSAAFSSTSPPGTLGKRYHVAVATSNATPKRVIVTAHCRICNYMAYDR
eukprot:SAG11_NODE_943_length_6434_cov_3.493133_2_plen_68_part_00